MRWRACCCRCEGCGARGAERARPATAPERWRLCALAQVFRVGGGGAHGVDVAVGGRLKDRVDGTQFDDFVEQVQGGAHHVEAMGVVVGEQCVGGCPFGVGSFCGLVLGGEVVGVGDVEVRVEAAFGARWGGPVGPGVQCGGVERGAGFFAGFAYGGGEERVDGGCVCGPGAGPFLGVRGRGGDGGMVVGVVHTASGVDDHAGGKIDGGHTVLDEEFEVRVVAHHEDAHGFADGHL